VITSQITCIHAYLSPVFFVVKIHGLYPPGSSKKNERMFSDNPTSGTRAHISTSGYLLTKGRGTREDFTLPIACGISIVQVMDFKSHKV